MELMIQNASCGYDNHPILKEVSLTLRQGEIVAILGPNGIGKTTIFKSVLGFLPLLEGRITLNGYPREQLTPKQFSRHVGYVPQSHEPPFPYSVPDVVVMGRASRLKNLETYQGDLQHCCYLCMNYLQLVYEYPSIMESINGSTFRNEKILGETAGAQANF